MGLRCYLDLWDTHTGHVHAAGCRLAPVWRRRPSDDAGRLWVEAAAHVILSECRPITPYRVERVVEHGLGIARSAAVGIGPVVFDNWWWSSRTRRRPGPGGHRLDRPVRRLIEHPVAAVLTLRRSRRHPPNAKIDRRRRTSADTVLAGGVARRPPEMRVLVTGASSLIGRRLAETLARRGDSVVCFQRHASGIPSGERALIEVLGDVRDAGAVDAAVAECDAVVHLAAKVGVVGRWEEYRSVNVDGTANVLAAARRAGIGRFVHVSSPSVAHGGGALVGAAADPPVLGRRRAYYAESKAIAETRPWPRRRRTWRWSRSGRISCGVPATRSCVGPHRRASPFRPARPGRQWQRARRHDLHRQRSECARRRARRGAPGARCAGHAYVIANGEPRPIRDLIAGICAAAGVEFAPRDVPLAAATRVGSVVERVWPVLRRSDEPPLTRFLAEQLGTAHSFDPRPAARDLGWAPTVSIDDGLRRLAEWYATDPEIGR